MTFKDVALKNFKHNFRKYFSYFLCSSFSITVLLMCSVLLYNQNIINKFYDTPMYSMIRFAFVITAMFSLVFISYGQSSFTKSRGKEFGLFLTLGMTIKDIHKLIMLENILISFFSLLIGLISGTVLSRIFFMVNVRILAIPEVGFSLDTKSYILTLGTFLIIISIILILTKWQTSQLEISQLIVDNRRENTNKKRNVFLGFVGLVFIISSYVLLDLTLRRIIFPHQSGFLVMGFILMCIVGLYLAISQFGYMFLVFCKVKNSIYYKNILSLSDISHKFNQYKKILFSVSMLSALAIFFIGFIFSLYVSVTDAMVDVNPYDLVIVDKNNSVGLTSAELDDILTSGETPLVKKDTLDFLDVQVKRVLDGEERNWGREFIFSVDNYNNFTGRQIKVKKGYAVTLKAVKEVNQWCNSGDTIKLITDQEDQSYQLNFQEEINGFYVNEFSYHRVSTYFAIILNVEDYNLIKAGISEGNHGKFRVYNYENWRKTGVVYENLLTRMMEIQNINMDIDKAEVRFNWPERPISKLFEYEAQKSEFGYHLFIMSFIGILFLISSGTVLYFKTYMDIEAGKDKYKKLFKIGITESEMKQEISEELKPIFFVPIILGSILGFLYIKVMVVNVPFREKILLNSLIIIGAYFIFQTVFYLLTRKKYIDEIIKGI